MGTRDRQEAQGDRRDGRQVGLPRPRSVEQRDRRNRQVRQAPKQLARTFVALPKKMNPLVGLAVLLVIVFVALSVATPLRNYFQQEAELAQVNAKIQDQLEERDRLEAELDRYQSEAYIREQARTRLGVVEQGESAFRLMDPRIDASSPSSPGTDDSEDEPDPWYTQLWGSVATPSQSGGDGSDSDGDGEADPDSGSEGGSSNLPIDPEQPEEPAQEGDPEVQRELQDQQQQQQQGAQ
ncbi:MAG TPA: septum formation initiator family protein [Candidatus Corynebacterium avicola]|uniref:Septum formation initiator family protein n=1 Tax=Candidatus Corynebacterium avicola TaxID=2838527 RepID=A0A9D1RMM2_9CORY|nr:septum formation initiator family protein [Candidatus Corynebacterium avicola]